MSDTRPLLMGKRWALLFEPRDIWVGVYWNKVYHEPWHELTFWVCIIPMLPIRVFWIWRAK